MERSALPLFLCQPVCQCDEFPPFGNQRVKGRPQILMCVIVFLRYRRLIVGSEMRIIFLHHLAGAVIENGFPIAQVAHDFDHAPTIRAIRCCLRLLLA